MRAEKHKADRYAGRGESVDRSGLLRRVRAKAV